MKIATGFLVSLMAAACGASPAPPAKAQPAQAAGAPASSPQAASVIEVVTVKLKPGVTPEQFRPIDKAVETEHVARQPGFVSREAAAGSNGDWLVIVHWRSVADAEASMKSFAAASAAQPWMASVDAASMKMTRYTRLP